jgi:hypothetical protein
MECLIGKLPSISTTSKSFKKSKNLLHSQQPAQKHKESFWISGSFGGLMLFYTQFLNMKYKRFKLRNLKDI